MSLTIRSNLVCTRCGTPAIDGIAITCACGGGYETAYDWDALAGWRPGSGPDRFAPLLPLGEGMRISLGEGETPVVEADGAVLKCEFINPTGSYKDRIASVGIGLAVAAGAAGWIGTSSGNSGAAFAAYGARAGLAGSVFTIASIPPQKRGQIEIYGAAVHIAEGLGDNPRGETELFRSVAERAVGERLALAITARAFNAAAMDGIKPMAYELFEQLGRAPDAVYVPTGGGGLLASLWRGFDDLHRLGIASTRPRMIVVQPEGCAPIHRAIAAGADTVAPIDHSDSAISGLQLTAPPDGDLALAAVRESSGTSVAVSDEDAITAQIFLARNHGLLVEPASALAFAGYQQVADAGINVVILTGSGLKTPIPQVRADG